MEKEADACARCAHARDVHHSTGCDGNAAAERAFWAAFESQPGYLQTRESIDELEREQPRQCACSVHHYTA